MHHPLHIMGLELEEHEIVSEEFFEAHLVPVPGVDDLAIVDAVGQGGKHGRDRRHAFCIVMEMSRLV